MQWDPDSIAFQLPLIGLDISWYGILFTTGFALSLLVLIPKLRDQLRWCGHDESRAMYLADKFTFYVVIGTVVGARLGEILFYDWPYYAADPKRIFYVWEGGLASHGGGVGITLALLAYRWRIKKEFPNFTFGRIGDSIAVCVPLVGAMIRLGNFVNQGIIGTETSVPWAITLMHPRNGAPAVPRHPVQLYEAVCYFLIFGLMLLFWPIARRHPGKLLGLLFITLFTARFFLEFFKAGQSVLIEGGGLLMGQYLSLPFILIGCFLFFRWTKNRA